MRNAHISILKILILLINYHATCAYASDCDRRFFIGFELLQNNAADSRYVVKQRFKSPPNYISNTEQDISFKTPALALSAAAIATYKLSERLSVGMMLEYMPQKKLKRTINYVQDAPLISKYLENRWTSSTVKIGGGLDNSAGSEVEQVSLSKKIEHHDLSYKTYALIPKIQFDLYQRPSFTLFTDFGLGLARIIGKLESSCYIEGTTSSQANNQIIKNDNFSYNHKETIKLLAKNNLALIWNIGVRVPVTADIDFYGYLGIKHFGKIPNVDISLRSNIFAFGTRMRL
jgi:hypothetical protein